MSVNNVSYGNPYATGAPYDGSKCCLCGSSTGVKKNTWDGVLCKGCFKFDHHQNDDSSIVNYWYKEYCKSCK